MAVSRWEGQKRQEKYRVYRKGVCRKVLHAARSRGGCPTQRSVLAMPGDKALPNLANLAPEAVPSATERAGSCTFHFKRVLLPRLPISRPGTAIPAPGLPQRHFAWAVCSVGSLLLFDIRVLGPPPMMLGPT